MSLLGELQDQFGYLNCRPGMPRSVGETDELIRIRDLPRRDWRTDPDLPELIQLLTLAYRYNSTPCPDPKACAGCIAQSVKPAQAALFRDAYDQGEGAFAPLRVGAGKTLASFLLPTVLRAQRPLLIVPAGLLEKTELELRQYARHWKILPTIRVISYEWLAHPNQLNWLAEYAPDLIVCDESHKLKSTGSKCTKRLGKYLKATKTKAVFMTGSASGRSIREYWHYLRWALPSKAPVPSSPIEMGAWAYALDEKVPPEARFEPGALLTLGRGEGETELERARRAYQDRLTSTPAVISTLEDVPAMGLELTAIPVKLPDTIRAAILEMRRTWTTPAGEDFELAMDLWRHARTLGCGLVYYADPPPPLEWTNARRAWHQFVRCELKYAKSFDSVVHLVQQIEAGEIEDGGLLATWRAIEPTFTWNSVPHWVDQYMVRMAADWVHSGDRRVVWTEQKAFGEELSRLAGVPLFSTEGLDPSGRLIDQYQGPCVASVSSCREGHNLQWFNEALFTSPMSRGDRWEQALGRLHRDGQEADEVRAWIYLTCRESYEALAQSVRDSVRTEQTDGTPQKLCYSTKDFRAIEALIGTSDIWSDLELELAA